MALAWVPLAVGAADLGQRGPFDLHHDVTDEVYSLFRSAPKPLPSGDADRDGLADDVEQSLAERYAPVVILDRRDHNRPASIPWVLARVDFREQPSAALAGVVPSIEHDASPPVFSGATRAGSPDPKDWTTYVHVYPSVDGGVNIQYWFYYAYNDGPVWFDHESDWEHVTVRLDAKHRPVGLYLARHEDNDPGLYRRWNHIRLSGDHPVVLSASGTHATYADHGDLAWFESAGQCDDLDHCKDPVWRTWTGGGLANVGERSAPEILPDMMRYGGRWGRSGTFPGTSAPYGPTFARGFCSAGFSTCNASTAPAEAQASR